MIKFLICAGFSFALEVSSPEPIHYRDAIDRAQKLVLQKERLAASQLLNRAIQKENRNSVAYRELSKSLEQLTTIYITEKGQLLASYAQTLASEKPKEAMDQYLEALKLEPHHAGLLRQISRLQLGLGDCAKAGPYIKTLEQLNPLSIENQILSFQEIECRGDFDVLSDKLAQREGESDGLESHLRPILVSEGLHRKDLKKAGQVLASWEAADNKDPELYRWKWSMSVASAKPDRAAAEQYIRNCRALTPQSRGRYVQNPALCRSVDKISKEMQQVAAASGEVK